MYRMYNGVDHMMSLDPNEGTQVGYYLEGEAFQLFSDAGVGNRTALYRCVIPGSNGHFVSTQPDCEGQQTDFFMGFAQSFQDGYAPNAVYRCVSAGNDHLITLDSDECTDNAYQIEGILGYVP